MATSEQVTNFIKMIAPIAQAQAKKHGDRLYASICIAQACHESGYGTSAKMKKANAVYGIKVGKSAYNFGTAWKGKAYKTGTTEYYDGKNPTKIVDFFRAYDSISDSTEDYMDMLCHCKRYKGSLNCPSPQKSIEAIVKGGYATGPDYASHIMQIVRKYDLTQFDYTANISSNPYTAPTVNLRRGSRGAGVKWLQYELNKLYGIHLVIDGVFGFNTETSVIRFQKEHNLKKDGVVGKLTREAILRS